MPQRIQVRKGTVSAWTTANPVLASGEIGYQTDTNTFKFGDGSTAWTALPYAVPRFRYNRMVCANGSQVVSVNSTTLAVLTFMGNPIQVTVPAVAGDVVELGLNGQLADAAVGYADFGAATFNGTTELNRIPSPGAGNIPGWGFRNNQAYTYISGRIAYIIQASDIVSGQVTIKLMGFYANAVRTLFAGATQPLVFDVKNFGQ